MEDTNKIAVSCSADRVKESDMSSSSASSTTANAAVETANPEEGSTSTSTITTTTTTTTAAATTTSAVSTTTTVNPIESPAATPSPPSQTIAWPGPIVPPSSTSPSTKAPAAASEIVGQPNEFEISSSPSAVAIVPSPSVCVMSSAVASSVPLIATDRAMDGVVVGGGVGMTNTDQPSDDRASQQQQPPPAPLPLQPLDIHCLPTTATPIAAAAEIVKEEEATTTEVGRIADEPSTDLNTDTIAAAAAVVAPIENRQQVDEPSSSTPSAVAAAVDGSPAIASTTSSSTIVNSVNSESNHESIDVLADSKSQSMDANSIIDAAAAAVQVKAIESCQTQFNQDPITGSSVVDSTKIDTMVGPDSDRAAAPAAAVISTKCDSSATLADNRNVLPSDIVAWPNVSKIPSAPENERQDISSCDVAVKNNATERRASSSDKNESVVVQQRSTAVMEAEEAQMAAFWRNHQFKGSKIGESLRKLSVSNTNDSVIHAAVNRTLVETIENQPDNVISERISVVQSCVLARPVSIPSVAQVNHIASEPFRPERPSSVCSDNSESDLVIDESPQVTSENSGSPLPANEKCQSDTQSYSVSVNGAPTHDRAFRDINTNRDSYTNGVAVVSDQHSSDQNRAADKTHPPPLISSRQPQQYNRMSVPEFAPRVNSSADLRQTFDNNYPEPVHRQHPSESHSTSFNPSTTITPATPAHMQTARSSGPPTISPNQSMYVRNPDFSKHQPGPSTKDLSQLHVKPPDFTKISYPYTSDGLKMSKPNFENVYQSSAASPHHSMNPSNFAEISKKLNYISDLQLKTPTKDKPQMNSTPRSSSTDSKSKPFPNHPINYPHVKAPDFSNKSSASSFVPVPDASRSHVIHKTQYLPHTTNLRHNGTDDAGRRTPPPLETIPAPDIVYQTYPQLSQDVTMSIVAHPPSVSETYNRLPERNITTRAPPPKPYSSEPPQSSQKYQPYPEPYPPPPSTSSRRSNQPPDNYNSAGAPVNAYVNRLPDPYMSRESETNPDLSRTHPGLAYKPHLQPHPSTSRTGTIKTTGTHHLPTYTNRTLSETTVQMSSRNTPENYVKQNSSFLPRNENPGTYYETSMPKPQHHPSSHQPSPHRNSITNSRGPNMVSPVRYAPYPNPYPVHSNSQPETAPAPNQTQHKSRSKTKQPVEPPGHMNPPPNWNRISQSPISLSSSPLSQVSRVSQSPIGNSPSPHSPHVSGPIPNAPSPTFQYSSPHQTPSRSPISYKHSSNYYPPPVSVQPTPLHYPPSDPSRYPQEAHPYKGRPNDSTTAKPSAQPPTKRVADYVDLTSPPHRVEPKHHPSVPAKSIPTPAAGGSKSNTSDPSKVDKTNHTRNTIMDPYRYRQISEVDRNYEIIKKTLHKDKVPRSDADLSRNIFEPPRQSNKEPYKTSRPTPAEQNDRGFAGSYPPQAVRERDGVLRSTQDPTQSGFVPIRADSEIPSKSTNYSSYRPQPSLEKELSRHDLSVTVSRISAESASSSQAVHAPGGSSAGRNPNSYSHYYSQPKPTIQPNTRPSHPPASSSHSNPPAVASIFRDSSVSSTVANSGSPLDLSVKTVKTKADSTGCENHSMSVSASSSSSRSRDHVSSHPSLKVDFAPNFQNHSSAQPPRASLAPVPNASHPISTAPPSRNHLHEYQPVPSSSAMPKHPQHQYVLQPQQQEQLQLQQQQHQRLLQQQQQHQQHQHGQQNHHSYLPGPPPPSNTYTQDVRSAVDPKSYDRNSNSIPTTGSTSKPARHPAPPVRPSIVLEPYRPPTDPKKPYVINPSVPMIFGQKPEELKNLPVVDSAHSTAKTSTYASKKIEESLYNRKKADSKRHVIEEATAAAITAAVSTSHPPRIAPVGNDYPNAIRHPSAFYSQHPVNPERPRIPIDPNAPYTYDQQHRSNGPPPPPVHSRAPYYGMTTDSDKPHPHDPVATRYPAHPSMVNHSAPDHRPEYNHKRLSNTVIEHPAEKRPKTEMPKQNAPSQYPIHKPIRPEPADQPPPTELKPSNFVGYRDGSSDRRPYPPNHMPVPDHPGNMPYPIYGHQPATSQRSNYIQQMVPQPSQPSPVVPEKSEHHHIHQAVKPETAFDGPYTSRPKYPVQPHPSHPPTSEWMPHIDNTPSQQHRSSFQPPAKHEMAIVPPAVQSEPPPVTYRDPTKFGGYRMNQQQQAARAETHYAPINSQPQEFTQILPQSPTRAMHPTAGALKGADQNVIIKLRNNLEAKEIEKQHKLRHQSSSETGPEEDGSNRDMASLIAARIRTKGELKGFTPISVEQVAQPSVESRPIMQPETDEHMQQDTSDRKVQLVALEESLNAEISGEAGSGFDLMNWGDACDDFAMQLETGGAASATGSAKKRGRGRLPTKSINLDVPAETVEAEVPLDHLTDSHIDTDQNVVNIVKTDNTLAVDEDVAKMRRLASSSSDEDTPLVVLRQQSLNEAKIRMEVEGFSSSVKDSTDSGRAEREQILERLGEKSAKSKQREKREQEKKITIKSSSDSDTVADRLNSKRTKKIIRKPRTLRGPTVPTTGNDSSDDEDKAKKSVDKDSSKRRFLSSSTESEPLKQRKKAHKLESASSESSSDSDETKISEIVSTSNKQPAEASIVTTKEEESSSTDEEETGPSVDQKTPPNKKTTIVAETMTRSKRKREKEAEIANSKVLRNDRVIMNVPKVDLVKKSNAVPTKAKPTPKSATKNQKLHEDTDDTKSPMAKKRASSRVSSKTQIESDGSEESGGEGTKNVVRLRNRDVKPNQEATADKPKLTATANADKSSKKSKAAHKAVHMKEPVSKATVTTGKDWEQQQQQLYEFKRSLKIPDSLISVGPWHRKSTSLPDLDPQHSSDTSENFSENNKRVGDTSSGASCSTSEPLKKESKRGRPSNASKVVTPTTLDPPSAVKVEIEDVIPKSIIDLLHQRVSRPLKPNKKFRPHHSESKILPQSNEVELLPTPGADGEIAFKKHLNVFEPSVIKSRTRKEHNVQKTQDIIRNVFGGESDRPASAPPLNFESNANDASAQSNMPTYDQKYQQYLRQMNNVDIGDKIRKNKPTNVIEVKKEPLDQVVLLKDIKQEVLDHEVDSLVTACEDDETQDTIPSVFDIKDEIIEPGERVDTPSVHSEREGQTPNSIHRNKKNRGSRRKGSSGFDYIRKKKKPAPVNSDGTPIVQPKRRPAAINFLEVKNEQDINREIRGWVLNKGVGESVLHKAARLGYIDVIAFCLERLEMSPNAKDNAGYTPLHEACSKGRLDIALMLLQYGANHSDPAHAGTRPLHDAVENGCMEMVRLLLSYGADPILATYGGQTPIMLAEDDEDMIAFLKNHLLDVQNTGPNKQPWRFEGAWKIHDHNESGYDIFADVPNENGGDHSASPTPATSPKSLMYSQASTPTGFAGPSRSVTPKPTDKRDSNSNNIHMPNSSLTMNVPLNKHMAKMKDAYKNLSQCSVVLNHIDPITRKNVSNSVPSGSSTMATGARSVPVSPATTRRESDASADDDSDGEMFEIEEADAPHVPLYHLRDEGSVKWALLNDLCVMLKVKSKDTLLKQICPSSPVASEAHRELLRELKMAEFLERATCLQLLCAGEKLNINSSKVVLVKYNDSVKNLLGVKTIMMRL